MRLIKYLKVNGNLTNNEVKSLYSKNMITVNNEIKPLLYNVKDNDIIKVEDEIIKRIPLKYFLYNKPRGILSDISDSPSSYVNHISLPYKLMPAGRLDKDSEGLMILTNDGEYIDKLINPKTHVEKEYYVVLKNLITNEFIEAFSKINSIDGVAIKPFKFKKIDAITISITLSEGKYHQIRKMVNFAQNKVVVLRRIRIDKYTLDDLGDEIIKEIKP